MKPPEETWGQKGNGYRCRFGVEGCGENSKYCERCNEEFKQFIEFLDPGCDHEFPTNTQMPRPHK